MSDFCLKDFFRNYTSQCQIFVKKSDCRNLYPLQQTAGYAPAVSLTASVKGINARKVAKNKPKTKNRKNSNSYKK